MEIVSLIVGNQTVVDDKMNVQGQNIIEGSGTRRPHRSSSNPLWIRRHSKEHRDDGINREITDLTILTIQRERWHANEVLSAKKKPGRGGIIDED
jgi:hypothetical protein